MVTFALDPVEERAFVAELSEDVAEVLFLEDIDGVDHVRMMEQLQRFLFVVQQVLSHLVVDLGHVYDLAGHLIAVIGILA